MSGQQVSSVRGGNDLAGQVNSLPVTFSRLAKIEKELAYWSMKEHLQWIEGQLCGPFGRVMP